jgi:hypothetical protein
MLEAPTSLTAKILALPQEEQIQLAITAIAEAGYKPNGDQLLLTCQAATMYQVPCTTLGNHMKGLCTCAEAHKSQRCLLPAEEEVLVKWAKVLGRQGIPLMYPMLVSYASEIAGKQVGDSWPK